MKNPSFAYLEQLGRKLDNDGEGGHIELNAQGEYFVCYESHGESTLR